MPHPVTIRGKRRWYAPWLRYPDRVEMRLSFAEICQLTAAHHPSMLEAELAPNNALLSQLEKPPEYIGLPGRAWSPFPSWFDGTNCTETWHGHGGKLMTIHGAGRRTHVLRPGQFLTLATLNRIGWKPRTKEKA